MTRDKNICVLGSNPLGWKMSRRWHPRIKFLLICDLKIWMSCTKRRKEIAGSAGVKFHWGKIYHQCKWRLITVEVPARDIADRFYFVAKELFKIIQDSSYSSKRKVDRNVQYPWLPFFRRRIMLLICHRRSAHCTQTGRLSTLKMPKSGMKSKKLCA